MATTREHLPTPDELELAEHKGALYVNDLDRFVDQLREGNGDTMTPEEYLRLRDEGKELPPAPEFDRDVLARIVVFATETLTDAERIEEKARELQQVALALYHEQWSPSPSYWERYWERVRAWHRESAETGDDG